MKKILVFLVVLLTVTTTALAEPFQLHSGTQFGMDMEEVKQIETEAGYEVGIGSTGWWSSDPDDIWLHDSNLAGAGGYVYYDFDSDSHELNMCLYEFINENENTIDGLIKAYTKKYGNTVAEGDNYIDISGKAHDVIDGFDDLRNKPLYTVTQKEFYQWIYQLDDGSAVDIMMVVWNLAWYHMPWEQKTIPDRLDLYVTYSFRSPDEMKVFYSEIQEIDADI